MTDVSVAALPRRRPLPRRTYLASREHVTPRVVRATFEGGELAGFGPVLPGAYIKLIFGDLPEGWTPGAAGPRPVSRTYTPRHFDDVSNRLQVEFLLHGKGVAAEWVHNAVPGDPLLIAGPGSGMDVPSGTRHAVLVADETALPAAGMILEALPQGCATTILAEVENAAEERPLSSRVAAEPNWLHRAAHNTAPCALLVQQFGTLHIPPDALVWIACEASAMRRMRSKVLATGFPKHQLTTRGYWQLGQADHPDHDYGE